MTSVAAPANKRAAQTIPVLSDDEIALARRFGRRVMLIRRDGLAATMSRYLIKHMAANPRSEVMSHTEIVGLEGAAVVAQIRQYPAQR